MNYNVWILEEIKPKKKNKIKKLTVQVAQTQPLQRMNVCLSQTKKKKKKSALINWFIIKKKLMYRLFFVTLCSLWHKVPAAKCLCDLLNES